MTNQELVTCAVEKLPIKVALINNGNLGMVRQWQTLFYDQHYSHTNLKPGETYLPDFLMLAESMGCAAFRVTKPEDVEPTIRKAEEINDRPVVIDFIVGEERRCGQWSPPARPTKKSSTHATCDRCSTRNPRRRKSPRRSTRSPRKVRKTNEHE